MRLIASIFKPDIKALADKKNTRKLRKALFHKDLSVQSDALAALINIRDNDVINILCEDYFSINDKSMQSKILDFLHASNNDDDVKRLFIQILGNDKQHEFHINAIRYLEKHRSNLAIEAIEKAFYDNAEQVPGEISSSKQASAKEAVKVLITLKNDHKRINERLLISVSNRVRTSHSMNIAILIVERLIEVGAAEDVELFFMCLEHLDINAFDNRHVYPFGTIDIAPKDLIKFAHISPLPLVRLLNHNRPGYRKIVAETLQLINWAPDNDENEFLYLHATSQKESILLKCKASDAFLNITLQHLKQSVRKYGNELSDMDFLVALSNINFDKAVAVILSVRHPNVLEAYNVYKQIGFDKILPSLLKALKTPDETNTNKELILYFLEESKDFRALSPLIQMIDSKSYSYYVMKAIGKLGYNDAVEPLIQALDNGSYAAIDALREIGDVRAVPALTELVEKVAYEDKYLDDNHRIDIIHRAICALYHIGGKGLRSIFDIAYRTSKKVAQERSCFVHISSKVLYDMCIHFIRSIRNINEKDNIKMLEVFYKEHDDLRDACGQALANMKIYAQKSIQSRS